MAFVTDTQCKDTVYNIGSNYKLYKKILNDLSCNYKLGCFLVLRKPLLVSFCVVVWVLFSAF